METTDRGEMGKRAEAHEQEEVRRAIGEESPEGRPAGQEMTRSGLKWLLVVLVGVLVVAGVLIAVLVNSLIGVIMSVLGLALLVFNPVLWASFARAKDREKVEGER